MLPDPRRPTRDALTGADSVDDGRPGRRTATRSGA